ncbi:MAG: MoaD/ThiS family protein [Proteobacteria bacterium]|nr:MoaD/ThiS family protein [Pseudomonadota bacterium]
MPLVLVPTAYRAPTRGEGEVPVAGETVEACLEAVEAKYAGFLELVLDAERRVHPFVKLFLNGVQLDPAEALATPVAHDDRVEVLAAIAGG